MILRTLLAGMLGAVQVFSLAALGTAAAQGVATLSVKVLADDLVELSAPLEAGSLSIECVNPATDESGSARLLPLVHETDGASVTYRVTLRPVWAALPYPIDPWRIDSKPLAIITQRDGSPLEMTPAQLREAYGRTVAYMLETASHTYSLPLGDGALDCIFSATDGQGTEQARSAPVRFEFGRGLPDSSYAREQEWPAHVANWPTWMLTDEPLDTLLDGIALPTEFAPDDVNELIKGPIRADEVRKWDNGTAVGPWIEIMMDAVMRHYVSPPRASHLYALVSVAAYESLVAQARLEAVRDFPVVCQRLPAVQPVGTTCDAVRPFSEHMVVAGAASTVLVSWFPDEAARYEALVPEAFAARIMARTHTRAQLEASLALGRHVGALVAARMTWDNSRAQWDGTPPDGVTWHPTPPDYAPPSDVMARTWAPWNLMRADQFRPPPPPAPGSPGFEADLQEVYAVSQGLTIEQQQIASSWEDKRGTPTPAGHWNIIALDLVRSYGWSTPNAALLFATLNTAEHDAFIAVWDTKYAYWSIRPVSAIRERIDPNWLPYAYTPAFPSYISGHTTVSTTASVVLAAFFPDKAEQLVAWADEAALSRIYGGIHFASDNLYGKQVGHSVAAVALDHVQSARQS